MSLISVLVLTVLSLGANPDTAPQSAAESLLLPQPFMEATRGEQGRIFASTRATRDALLADRVVYNADEMHGQFLAMFFSKVTDKNGAELKLDLSLTNAADQTLEKMTLTPVAGPKLPILIATGRLTSGKYTLHAILRGADDAVLIELSRDFERSDARTTPLAFPTEGIVIAPHAQTHVPNGHWPISTGVPIPKATLRDTN